MLVNWHQMKPSAVCFGAKGDSFGTLATPTSGDVITFKLIYPSGYVECAAEYQSFWGCNVAVLPTEYKMGTYITDSQKKSLLPKDEFLKDPLSSDCKMQTGITPCQGTPPTQPNCCLIISSFLCLYQLDSNSSYGSQRTSPIVLKATTLVYGLFVLAGSLANTIFFLGKVLWIVFRHHSITQKLPSLVCSSLLFAVL